jgi:hypothetical protein
MHLRDHAGQAAPRRLLRIVEDEPGAEPQADLSAGRYAVGVAGVLALAFLVRLSFTLRSDFPLNDGALFYVMVRDIQNNGYALPAFTSFDNTRIPFGYPPLTFYLAGAVDALTPMGLLGAFRWLPLAGSTLIVAAFAPLARSLMRTRVAALTATMFFAMLGPAFIWMVMGGGLTRSFGFVFAVLTMWQAHEMYARRTYWRIPVVSVVAALAVTSHLEMAWLAAFSSALFFAVLGRNRAGVVCSAGVALATLALSAPWWATVVAHHGIEPFRAAAASGNYPLTGPILLIQYDVAFEPLFAIVGALGLLGVVTSLTRRQYLLPMWLVTVAVLDARALPTSATVPLAMLAAVGLLDALLPIAMHPAGIGSLLSRERHGGVTAVSASPAFLPGVVATVVACYVILSAFITGPKILTGLTRDERDAMTWAGQNTPADSHFAVITGDAWAVDRTSEWFPVISGRASLATVQGREWISGQFRRSQEQYTSLQDCALADGDCLYAWSAATDKQVDYVYIARIAPRVPQFERDPCCTSIRLALARDSRFTLVFDGPGATIYRAAR